jgi:GT2 family glycosyltransferase
MRGSKTNLKIGAVVVTYNRNKLLIECLNALLNQTVRPNKILIIDNASTDGTRGELNAAGFLRNPLFEYILLPDNLGGAGGFHEGVKRGYDLGFDWLWLMDDDAMPKENALEILIDSLNDLPEDIVGLSCLKVDHIGAIEKIHRGWFNKGSNTPTPLADDEYKKPDCFIGYSSFVGFLIQRKAIEKVGFPNKDFFIWFDDVEYSLRLGSVGKLKLITGSVIVHKDRISNTNTFSIPIREYWKIYYGVRNRIHILRNYFKTPVMNLFLFVYMKGMIKIVLFENHKGERSSLFYKGWSDGIKGRLGKLVDPVVWQREHSSQ